MKIKLPFNKKLEFIYQPNKNLYDGIIVPKSYPSSIFQWRLKNHDMLFYQFKSSLFYLINKEIFSFKK